MHYSRPPNARSPHWSECTGRVAKFVACVCLFVVGLFFERDFAVAADPLALNFFSQRGTASWYGSKVHQGKKTASGRSFDRNSFMAAHGTLPFGSIVRVYNLRNNKQALVSIEDRGPYAKSRVVDVSYRAAESLGMLNSGVVAVAIELVGGATGRALNSANSFYLRLANVDAVQKAHSLSSSFQARLGREIRALTVVAHGRKEYALCVGPFRTFFEAEAAYAKIVLLGPVLEIVEAPTKGGDIPLHVPPVLLPKKKPVARKR